MSEEIDLQALSQLAAKQFYEEKIRVHLPQILNETKARLLDIYAYPKTQRQAQQELNLSYQSVRSNTTELYESGLLVRSDYMSKKGYVFATNYANVLRHLSTHQTGQLLLKEFGVKVAKTNYWNANRDTIYREFPEPKHGALQLRLGNEHTDVFKFTIASRDPDNRISRLLSTAGAIISHVWYRNYLLNEEGTNPVELPAPNAIESRACLRGIARSIRDYANMLDTIVDNEVLWSESTAFDAWRVIGDLPLEWSKQYSAAVSSKWTTGELNSSGRPGTLETDYEAQKAFLTRYILDEWTKHQENLNPEVTKP